jgi:hypothetical protein
MSQKKDSLGISNKEYYELLTLGRKVTRSTSKKPNAPASLDSSKAGKDSPRSKERDKGKGKKQESKKKRVESSEDEESREEVKEEVS